MKIDWAQIKTNAERCLNSAQKGERGGLRVHCSAAERMLKKTKDPKAQELLGLIRKARSAIETEKSVEYLQQALELAAAEAPTA